MIPSHRRRFNQAFSDAKYARFLALLEQRCGEPTPFRHSETPCFLPGSLIDTMARYGREMVEQLLANPQYEQDSRAAIPSEYRVPGEDAVPLFVQADFGLDAELRPQLVEIQGFPTLYAYQPLLAEAYRGAYEIDESLLALPGGLDAQEYRALLRAAIVGKQDPENVVLLEIDPAHQKTRHDFLLTEQQYGVRTVDISSVVKQGNRLFYQRDGVLTPIRRIYNRAIVDELVRKQIPMAFDFRDDLDVEWAGHPNWFFRLSKFSLPYLDHPAVPRTRFLDAAGDIEQPGALRAEAPLLVRRRGRDRRSHRGSVGGRTGGAAEPVHPAGARRFPAGGRYAVRPNQDRDPHHVHLAGPPARGEHHHPYGPRRADGRGSQQGLSVGRRVRGVY